MPPRLLSSALVVIVALTLTPISTTANDALQLRALYDELQDFKNDLIFRTVGFGVGNRFHDWLRRVEALQGGDATAYAQQLGLLPGELIQLATEYMRDRGSGQAAQMWESMVIADSTPVTRSGKLVGRWRYQLGGYMGLAEIRRVTENRYTVHTRYSDGSQGTDSFTTTIPKRGETLRLMPDSGYDIYVVHEDGTMGIYDELGLILTGLPE